MTHVSSIMKAIVAWRKRNRKADTNASYQGIMNNYSTTLPLVAYFMASRFICLVCVLRFFIANEEGLVSCIYAGPDLAGLLE